MKPLLIRHLEGEPVGRFPVWMMRQAGRYLPNYREVRAKHTFWEMVTIPEVAREVSLQPVRELGVDAVIFFSDILTLPYGMGIPVEMVESIGPVINQPLRRASEFTIFRDYYADKHTGFVNEALRQIRRELAPEKTLIGFAGAPWTVGCYLIEGRGKKGFESVRHWASEDPTSLEEALKDLAGATLNYLRAQVASGAQVVQLFDTWLSEMSVSFFTQRYLPLLNEIFNSLKETGVKVAYFAKGVNAYVSYFNRLNVDILSVESDMMMGEMDRITGRRFSLQGNLAPEILRDQSEAEVRAQTRQLVQQARLLAKPAIINLGHGIFPKTPVPNVKAFVEEAQQLWI